MVGGNSRQIFEALVFGWRDDRIDVLTIDESSRTRDLEEVRDLLARHRLHVVIDRVSCPHSSSCLPEARSGG